MRHSSFFATRRSVLHGFAIGPLVFLNLGIVMNCGKSVPEQHVESRHVSEAAAPNHAPEMPEVVTPSSANVGDTAADWMKRGADLEAAGMCLGDTVELRCGGRSLAVPFALTYGEVSPGRVAVCEDSFRTITLAVNQGSAAKSLRAGRGQPMVIARRRGPAGS